MIDVGQPLAGGIVAAAIEPGLHLLLRQTAIEAGVIQLAGTTVIGFARRYQRHRAAVTAPVHRNVNTRVPGQPLRLATGAGDDIDIDIAFIAGGESDLAAIGREQRCVFLRRCRGQAPRLAAVTLGDPDVTGIYKRQMLG